MAYEEFRYIFGDQNNEEIQSFSDGDTPKVTPKEVKDTEEEVKKDQEDKEEQRAENDEGTSAEKDNTEGMDIEDDTVASADDYSDDELSSMAMEQILQIRFLPKKLEYGTPGGVDNNPPTCPNCTPGNTDAGDVAIIDAEVVPAEGTEENERSSDNGGSDDLGGGDDFGDTEFEGLRAEILEYKRYSDEWDNNLYVGIAGFGDIVSHLTGALKFLVIKAAKYARVTYLFCRKKISHMTMKMTTIQKLWKFKINRLLPKISEERLAQFEIESFPYNTWIDACKVGLQCFDIVRSADRIVFDHAAEATTNQMKSFSNSLEHLGIKITANKRRINMDNLLDKRQFGNVPGLGFTKSQIPNCIRYLGDIAKCMPKSAKNELEEITNKCMEKSGAYALRINEAIEKGDITKGSKEHKEALDNVMKHTVRIDFIMMTMKTAYSLFDTCISDCEKVFSKLEDACGIRALVD